MYILNAMQYQYSILCIMHGVSLFFQQDIEQAIQALKKSIAVCDRYRHKFSMLESLSKARSRAIYNDLTEGKSHGLTSPRVSHMDWLTNCYISTMTS